MAFKETLALVLSLWAVAAQRPSFAGSRPIGFPEVITPANELGNRFGDDSSLPLPLEANGDRALVERISKMPIDKQPFWYINWKALEENRKNPVTYEQRPNSFSDLGVLTQENRPSSGSSGANSGSAGSSGLNSRFGSSQSVNSNQGNHQHYKNSRARYQSY